MNEQYRQELRDALAKEAMIRFLNAGGRSYVEENKDDIARISYLMADAMLEARKK